MRVPTATIRPLPAACIGLSAARMQQNAARRLIFIILSQVSSLVSATLEPPANPPTRCTKASSGPCSNACFTMDSQPSAVDTSAEIVANGAGAFQPRSTPITFAPLARNSWHTAVPSPPLAPVMRTFIRSLYIQTNRAHQLQSVASLHHSRPQMIVEMDLAILDVILEMHVARPLAQACGDLRQREVMRSHQSDRAALHQTLNHRSRADATVMRVGAAQ